MKPNDLFFAVVGNAVRNALFQVGGTAFACWLATAWRAGAIILFAAFVVMTALEAIHVLGVISNGRRVMAMMRDNDEPGAGWLWGAQLVQLGSLALATGLLILLAGRIW